MEIGREMSRAQLIGGKNPFDYGAERVGQISIGSLVYGNRLVGKNYCGISVLCRAYNKNPTGESSVFVTAVASAASQSRQSLTMFIGWPLQSRWIENVHPNI